MEDSSMKIMRPLSPQGEPQPSELPPPSLSGQITSERTLSAVLILVSCCAGFAPQLQRQAVRWVSPPEGRRRSAPHPLSCPLFQQS